MWDRHFFTSLFTACVVLWCALPSASGVMAKKRCKVHGEILKKEKVPIVYGLIIDFVYPEAREELFPNSNRRVLGGCLEEEPQEEVVYYCLKCRAAEDKYRRDVVKEYHRTGKFPELGWWRKRAAYQVIQARRLGSVALIFLPKD